MHRLTSLVLLLSLAAVLVACDGTDEPTIVADDPGASPEAVEPSETEPEEPAEATATPEEDEAEGPAAEPPTFEEVCAGRDDEAFIEVLTPEEGAQVGDPFTVTGCGNTFEANYLWRVELPDGTVAAEGFGTMSCGSGCVGEFEQDIEVGATGPATLVLFESSPEDGSEQHVVEVPLTIG